MEILNWVQLCFNILAVSGVGYVFKSHIQLLREQNKVINEQASHKITNLKEKIAELEKNTPDNLAKSLNERVKVYESEVERLVNDKDSRSEVLKQKSQELEKTKNELEEVKVIISKLRAIDNHYETERLYLDLSIVGTNDLIQEYVYDFTTVQSLLDHIYMTYLYNDFEEYTYQQAWRLVERESGIVIDSEGKEDNRHIFDAGIIGGLIYEVQST
ncbi:TPA: hypothetical protein JG805_004466 [Vibrio parahaemolyticus]|nr:hypothetical protein [Vibrio parahaemolyticus]